MVILTWSRSRRRRGAAGRTAQTAEGVLKERTRVLLKIVCILHCVVVLQYFILLVRSPLMCLYLYHYYYHYGYSYVLKLLQPALTHTYSKERFNSLNFHIIPNLFWSIQHFSAFFLPLKISGRIVQTLKILKIAISLFQWWEVTTEVLWVKYCP